jgi:mannose-6-phosphate isomerase-like protein (cupin superfamily)
MLRPSKHFHLQFQMATLRSTRRRPSPADDRIQETSMHMHRNAELPRAALPGIEHTTLAGRDLGTNDISVWRQTVAAGAATPPHRHDREEVVLVEAGRGQLLIDGAVVEFGPDTTLVLPAGRDHQIVNSGAEPLRLLAVFPGTPVATLRPDGSRIALPWRS